MKNFTLMAAIAATALVAASSAARAEWYAGAGYTQFEYEGGDVGAVTGRLGYRVNPHFAVEGEGSIGVDDDDAVELNHNVGAYAVGILPVSPNFDLHGRIGYQTTQIDTPLGEAEDDGVGYGVGATWRLGNGLGIRGDFTRLEGDEGEADAISLSGVVNF